MVRTEDLKINKKKIVYDLDLCNFQRKYCICTYNNDNTLSKLD